MSEDIKALIDDYQRNNHTGIWHPCDDVLEKVKAQVHTLSQQVEKARDALMRVEANTHDEGLRQIARDTLDAMGGEGG